MAPRPMPSGARERAPVVIAEDLSRVPVERLREVGVAMTVVGGDIVDEG